MRKPGPEASNQKNVHDPDRKMDMQDHNPNIQTNQKQIFHQSSNSEPKKP